VVREALENKRMALDAAEQSRRAAEDALAVEAQFLKTAQAQADALREKLRKLRG
jgi:hypothetical protein